MHFDCFGDVIPLLECVQGGGGQIFDLFKRTYFMDGPKAFPNTITL